MKKIQFNQRRILRFHKFSRKGYALFSVCGKEVLVGVLSAATLTYAKADGISVRDYEAADSLLRQEVKLDEVVITGSRAPLTQVEMAKIVAVISRDDIQRAAVTSINDVLKLVSGVDVRQRGGFGVQTDISLRGGNFDQVTLLLNGVNITSPHTGHLSADFPLSPDDIDHIEVLEGAYGHGLCGAINVVTTTLDSSLLTLNLNGGSYGTLGANASLAHHSSLLSNQLSASYLRSDGATQNSAFQSTKAFWHGSMQLGSVLLTGQFGFTYKPYEANTFYGAASSDQWECTSHWVGSLDARIKLTDWFGIAGQFYWNHWADHYQWHKDSPTGENFHRVNAYGGSLHTYFNTLLGKTSVGFELREESIWSTKLGEACETQDKYNHHASRFIPTVFIEHNLLLSHWTVSPSLTYTKKQFLPGLSLAWRPLDRWKFYAGWTTGVSLPTFTSLYYSGTNIEGNKNLKMEKASDINVGLHTASCGFSADLQLFYSHKRDMIDWITSNEFLDDKGSTYFHSVNFTQDSYGADVSLKFLPRELWSERFPLRQLAVNYTWTHQDSRYPVEVLQSKYAMDFLRNKLVVTLDSRIWRNLNISLTWSFKDRIGADNPNYHLLDGKLSWDDKHFSVYVEGTNLLNKSYYDYITILQPGIQVLGGVNIKIFH